MNTSGLAKIDELVDMRFEQTRSLRRHLHSHPEVSGDERNTSLHLYQLLGDEGIAVRVGPEGRGVLADLPDPDDTSLPRIAMRADIDALSIHDAKKVNYRSRKDGVMHACGHDGHTAIVAGALLALNDLTKAEQSPWPFAVRAIFQPAEETVEGAREMIQVGALEGISAIIAGHVDPSRRLGQIGFRQGIFTANCDEVQIRVVGRGGHAARPHEASDSIAAAAQLINALYLFVPRATDSRDAVVVTIGQVQGGDNANVIPEEVRLRGTIRTLDTDVRRETFEHIRRLASGIGQTTDTKIEVNFGEGCGSIVNDGHLIELFSAAAQEVVGAEGIQWIARPSMGSEDFAFYVDQVPGAMVRWGCTSESTGGSPLHSPTFDMDEEVLRIGARVLARTVLGWSAPKHTGNAHE